ncbi:2-hydroxyacyl-CoA dehydratase [Dyella amyloliquefaciens]|uniref:2-hydroxyacyl-CoA dehydratase n=1 Tax=Dyella amyloliquefaciens TaxID=1770545 RepID=UPI00102EC6E4|nr:2-hydroxyacyl-CoA dehydratase [Dyella amyloliquefaciens]
MNINKDAYRQFQEELAALDKEKEQRQRRTAESPMESARREFLSLRDRYHLSVADVIAFFPEEEGVVYLQGLIAAAEAAPAVARKRRTKRQVEDGQP